MTAVEAFSVTCLGDGRGDMVCRNERCPAETGMTNEGPAAGGRWGRAEVLRVGAGSEAGSGQGFDNVNIS